MFNIVFYPHLKMLDAVKNLSGYAVIKSFQSWFQCVCLYLMYCLFLMNNWDCNIVTMIVWRMNILSQPSSFMLTLLCLTGLLILGPKGKLEVHLELCHKSVQQPLPAENIARRTCTHASFDDQDMRKIDCSEVQLSDKCSIFKS